MIELAALRRRLWRRYIVVNLVAVVPVCLYYGLAYRYFDFTASFTSPFVLSLPVLVFAPGYVFAYIRITQMFRQIGAALEPGSRPDSEVRRLIIESPRRLAIYAALLWLWGSGWAMVSGVVNFDGLGVHLWRILIAQLVSATIGSALTYLVVEDGMRPLYGWVLGGQVSHSAAVGIRPRLTLIWIVGSATYFVAVILIVTSLPGDADDPFVLGACSFALLIGVLVARVTARSVARPLEAVSKALARVEIGDLTASVEVDDAGEVGRLQAGFNRMVTGLRERERLERLLARHVGEEVAQRAITATGLGGVSLEATVMFVDIVGSTALASERPPEAIVTMINDFFGRVISAVGAEGGLVNQFQGDGALCIFGAPISTPDHAARALRAAAELRREIVDLGSLYPGFDAAIGISTGPVVAGDVGTQDRSEYTVIGDAANEASRLTDHAKARESRVLASERTISHAGLESEWLPAGTLELRGRPVPTGVFEPG